jgi:hypothetical protein
MVPVSLILGKILQVYNVRTSGIHPKQLYCITIQHMIRIITMKKDPEGRNSKEKNV